ncbi:nitrate reductase [Alteromonas sp. D210916BOD_24]|uniref:nitrate reductase n=1 Tax=Alteromonas sp. D210916BOD_24 TaxID=3157618 RepID=UPI00399C7F4B
MNMATLQPNAMSEQLRQTTCPYCGVGCGVDINCNVSERAITLDSVTGTPEHPANYGRLCVKGTNLLETNGPEGRLLHPTLAGNPVDWDTATGLIADTITTTIAQFGADAVAFYVSGQLLTEDYYIANKLMKGFIGSANIDTNSRLCMSSAVAAYKRAFGEDVVPCDYTDLEQTDLLVITGSNAAWAHPVLFQRITRAKRRNPQMKVVVIDPRKTETCTIADMHLAIKPGTDVALFNGLIDYAQRNGRIDKDKVAAFTEGLDATLKTASHMDTAQVALCCDMAREKIEAFYSLFCRSPRVVTFYSMGVNQSAFGVDKAQSIINCHLALDLIGRDGCGPFSITGQPNAMGGREVGGLANMLAAHCDLENPEHIDAVKTYWNAPVMPQGQGLKAVDLFNAIEQGKVKFVWIMGTNPVVSMPNRNQIERALAKCEMVVVSDIVAANDTLQFAHIALPATGWSEKDGTVTNSERRISRQRGILPAPGEAKHDWQIMCEVAKKMGFGKAFDFQHVYEIFNEYTGLTGYNNNGSRLLDLSILGKLTEEQYNKLSPFQWPLVPRTGQNELPLSVRPFANKKFSTPTGKARLLPVHYQAPLQQISASFPFILNSGRARDQWHTMTRTGKAAKLLEHMPVAYVHVHPADALRLKVKNGEYVALQSAAMFSGDPSALGSNKDKSDDVSSVIYPVKIDDTVRNGEAFIPIHWSAQWGSHSKLAALYASAVDAISGQPELKHGAIALRPYPLCTHGQIFICDDVNSEAISGVCEYWTKTPIELASGKNGTLFTVAAQIPRRSLLQSLVDTLPQHLTLIQFHHADYSACVGLADNSLCFAAFLGGESVHTQPQWAVPTEWLASLLGSPVAVQSQYQLLRCQVDEAFLNGQVVCSCFKVREKTISDAIKSGVATVTELGQQLQCGTNCGSCKPALAQLIDQQLVIETHSV